MPTPGEKERPASERSGEFVNGDLKEFDGTRQIFYDGYWIRYYEPPPESFGAKKKLLDALTRRTFHHTEPGINTPGDRLDQVRKAYDDETDPPRKRVNAAMLAGSLFNRATDIFTAIVDLEEHGIIVADDDDLMQQCEQCLNEALSLCGHVRHHSGEEGVDELWGEPVKVFTMSIADYYRSRYRKIAQAMKEIDRVGEVINETICQLPWFEGSHELVEDFIGIAKHESEILRSDPDYLRIWPEFVADGEKILEYRARIPENASTSLERHIKRGTNLLCAGKNLITWISNIRVPMPVSTEHYLRKCEAYRQNTRKFLKRGDSRK